MSSFLMVEQKRQNSNFLSYIKEFIEELKNPEIALIVEKLKFMKMSA